MLLDLSKKYPAGVWCIKNNQGKMLLISTKSIVNYLLTLMYAIEMGDRSIDGEFVKDLREGNVSLEMLEDNGFRDTLSMNMRLGVWLKKYNHFYSHQRKVGLPIIKIRMVRMDHFPYMGVYVNNMLVGLFYNKQEAEDWKNEYYKEEGIVTFAYNEPTQKWLQRK